MMKGEANDQTHTYVHTYFLRLKELGRWLPLLDRFGAETRGWHPDLKHCPKTLM